ncbi:hypothetical protein BD408DRAFT_432891 [Parasitella parasitica]|nr:hypothetical protein BD408DRAFT_432891 [Parasitella parasitica]
MTGAAAGNIIEPTITWECSTVDQFERTQSSSDSSQGLHPPANSTVLIRTDNTTSLSYIKQAGTQSSPLLKLATKGTQDGSAYGVQGNLDDQSTLGTVLDRPFADRTTALLPRHVSWLPDPAATQTDAFTLLWTNWQSHI